MEPINRYGITLRLITLEDAEFIVNLWANNPLVRIFISATLPTIESQSQWIEIYKKKEQLGLDYYFVAQDLNGKPYGTVRLYNFDEKSFELGSWIFMPNAPFGMAVKTHIIGLSTGFELSKTDYCRVTVRKANTKVLNYLNNFTPIMTKENDVDYYFLLSKENFDHFKDKILIFS